jgi:sialic acid synthase SpsE
VEIKKGTIFSRKNVTSKRTGGKGIPASFVYEVLGRKSNCDIEKNKTLYWKYLTD